MVKRRRRGDRSAQVVGGQTPALGGQTPAVGGQTPAVRGQPSQHVALLEGPVDDRVADELRKRGFAVKQNVVTYLKSISQSKRGEEGAAVVLREVTREVWKASDFALVARMVGGFLTSRGWINEAVRMGQPPQGVFYKGVRKRGFVLWLSEPLSKASSQQRVVGCGVFGLLRRGRATI